MKIRKSKSSFPPCRTIPQTLAFLYLATCLILFVLGLILVIATGFSFWKLAVFLLIFGAYLIALVFAVLATRNMPKKRHIRKFRKLISGRSSIRISDLARQTGLEPEELRKELEFLIRQNICPDGSFSEDGDFFFPDTSDKK